MDFARDLSAHRRLKDAVKVLMRGKGKQSERIADVRDLVRPLQPIAFPPNLQVQILVVRQYLFEDQKNVKAPSFKIFTKNVLELYEGIIEARTIAGIGSDKD